MIRHYKSHIEATVPDEVLAYVLNDLRDETGMFIKTLTLPPSVGRVPCALYGPRMGDDPVEEESVYYQQREGRKYASRMISRLLRPVRKVTVIAGPYEQESCILYHVYGGPMVPAEPGNPIVAPDRLAGLHAFWQDHAFAGLSGLANWFDVENHLLAFTIRQAIEQARESGLMGIDIDRILTSFVAKH